MLQNWLNLLYFIVTLLTLLCYTVTHCLCSTFEIIVNFNISTASYLRRPYLHYYTVRYINIWWRLADFYYLLPRSAHLILYDTSLC